MVDVLALGSRCWRWVRDVGIGFEVLALGSRHWRWVRGVGVGRESPAKFVSPWSTCWYWVRHVDVGFEFGHVGVGWRWVQDVGVGFEALVLGSRHWHWTRFASRVHIPMVDVLALGSSSDMLALGSSSRRWRWVRGVGIGQWVRGIGIGFYISSLSSYRGSALDLVEPALLVWNPPCWCGTYVIEPASL